MTHRFKRLTEENEGSLMSRCKCGWTSGWGTAMSVEDGEIAHLKFVERIRAQLARTPSMKDQRDYFRSMAEHPSQSERDRALWRQLANELTHRLNDAEPAEEHPTLI